MKNIITISREFGSGGKELGKRLADELGYAYYDKEVIEIIAKEKNLSTEYIDNIVDNGVYPLSFNFGNSFSWYSNVQKTQVELLVEIQKVLKEIAEKGNAVIVGRGANVILKDYNPINIFVYADMKSKINRCRTKEVKENENENEKEDIDDKQFEKMIKEIDSKRNNFINLVSEIDRYDMKNYNLCINTSGVVIKNIIKNVKELVCDYIEGRE